ncbi:hypothetical protein BB559_001031 [Furculomyces boomerangus]|uniref:Nucleotide-diphospho-sugar transferase domain-containing protein n=2 Tax=Harpellales TaxID=61421 RepID=A0A2T9YHM1_9FUNG|nr:hypothetical protein BB559_003975 [Furculomyces boomerangus]PVU99078.1 hypothetical protein BB559_001031 [Furculomyces boomerangus]PWA02978.1 hypothetical protein BB558_000884 [Smittium angustum]
MNKSIIRIVTYAICLALLLAFTLHTLFLREDLERQDDPIPEKNRKITYNDLNTPNYNNTIFGQYDDVVVLVHVKTSDSIFWLRNMYSDVNFLTVCENNKVSDYCDIVSNRKEDQGSSNNHVYYALSTFCSSKQKYKAYVKMDFQILFNKKYVYDILKEFSRNPNKRNYLGYEDNQKTKVNDKEYPLNSRFFAISSKLHEDFCSCNISEPKKDTYDEWFYKSVSECIGKDKIKFTPIDNNFVQFSFFKGDGVRLEIKP